MVTDDQGEILALPPEPDSIDFEGTGAGTCLIWHLSFEDDLTGAEVGMNAADLEGCFDLSDSIVVVRVTEGPLCITSTETVNPADIMFEIWPNPVKDQLQLSVQFDQRPEKLQVEIRSPLGGILHHQEFVTGMQLNTSLDVADLPAGMYMISIRTEDALTTKSFVKVK